MRDELSGSFALAGRADSKVATKDKKKLRGRAFRNGKSNLVNATPLSIPFFALS